MERKTEETTRQRQVPIKNLLGVRDFRLQPHPACHTGSSTSGNQNGRFPSCEKRPFYSKVILLKTYATGALACCCAFICVGVIHEADLLASTK